MKIKRIIRDNDRVMVSFVDENGNAEIQYFSKVFSNDEIIAVLNGTKKDEIPADKDSSGEEEKKATVPTLEVVTRQRVSREQMIAALTAAKIEVDIFDPAKLRAAYKKLMGKSEEK